jgi:drug/metabolite transporter (DMT)-like permease
LALALWGVAGVTQKLATNHISNELSTVGFWVASLGVAGGILTTQHFDWNLPVVAWAAALVSGVLLGLALWIGFAAYRGGKASVVTALIALYPVVTVVLAVPLFGEAIDLRKAVAVVLALVAAVALTFEWPLQPKKASAVIETDTVE